MANSDIPGARAAEGAARRATREAAPWVEKLARFGYAAKGAVYLLVGGLAVAAAFGGGGQATGTSGALTSIADSTFGRVILGLIALGLFGYVVWGFVRAATDPENDGAGHRVFYLVTSLIYGALAVEAARLAMGGGGGAGGGAGGGGGGGASHWSARLMEQPFGVWLVGLAGVAVGIYGIQQLINAWRVDLDDRLALGSMSRSARTWTIRTGRFGLAARGVVLTIIGGFFVTAAMQADPSEARGLGGVLGMMQDTPWLLGIIALGLLAYGVYNLVRARYRVIRPA
jgi:hypothetical protein